MRPSATASLDSRGVEVTLETKSLEDRRIEQPSLSADPQTFSSRSKLQAMSHSEFISMLPLILTVVNGAMQRAHAVTSLVMKQLTSLESQHCQLNRNSPIFSSTAASSIMFDFYSLSSSTQFPSQLLKEVKDEFGAFLWQVNSIFAVALISKFIILLRYANSAIPNA